MNIEEIDKWLDNEYGVSYTSLEKIHDWLCDKEIEKDKEIERLQRQKEELQINGLRQEMLFELKIKRLHSIIKEVSKLIKSKWEKDSYWEDVDDCLKYCKFNEFEKEDILEILDKENK